MTKNNINRRLRSQIVVTFPSKSPNIGPSDPILKSLLPHKKRDNKLMLSLYTVGGPPIPPKNGGTTRDFAARGTGDTHD